MSALDRCFEKRALCEKFLVPVPGGFFYRAVVHDRYDVVIVQLRCSPLAGYAPFPGEAERQAKGERAGAEPP